MVNVKVKEWQAKFSKLQGGKEIVSLMGETSTNLRLLEKGDVIVCTPTQVCTLDPWVSYAHLATYCIFQWDILSRQNTRMCKILGSLLQTKYSLLAVKLGLLMKSSSPAHDTYLLRWKSRHVLLLVECPLPMHTIEVNGWVSLRITEVLVLGH
jgi:hypothetical protein